MCRFGHPALTPPSHPRRYRAEVAAQEDGRARERLGRDGAGAVVAGAGGNSVMFGPTIFGAPGGGALESGGGGASNVVPLTPTRSEARGRPMLDEPIEPQNVDVLIVDDDLELRGEMADYLVGHGYVVHQAADARAARAALAVRPMQLIILDVMMPGEDGLTLCRKLRQQGAGPPILMLSALGESTDRVVGLELGADDYAVKPLPPRELLARVRALLRRQGAGPGPSRASAAYAFAGFRLDLARRQLKAPNGMVLQLTPAELSLLNVFMRFPGRVLSREELLREARGEDAEVLDRAVDIQISRLRRKLHAQSERELITTARGAGYMLDAKVTAL